MTEDKAFNAFLKAKLEADIIVPKLRRDNSRLFYRMRPILIAASLAIVCGVYAWQVIGERDEMRERYAVSALELLDESEDIATIDTFAEKLLAWQDAPFEELVN